MFTSVHSCYLWKMSYTLECIPKPCLECLMQSIQPISNELWRFSTSSSHLILHSTSTTVACQPFSSVGTIRDCFAFE